jgi:hypothetical protein
MLYGPAASSTPTATECATLASGFPTAGITVSVTNGNGTYGGPAPSDPVVGFQPASPGWYFWKASYSGDPPNTLSASHNANCSSSTERVEVQRIQTGISTRQFVYPQDKAVITASAGGNLAGTVTFEMFDTAANCAANTSDTVGTGGLLYREALSVAGASPQAKTTNNTSARIAADTTVWWRVAYTSTNAAQLGSLSDCVESTTVSYAGNDAAITLP